MPGYLQAPPLFFPSPPPMGGYPQPYPGWGSPFPFNNPFHSMQPHPQQPPFAASYGGYQPSIANYGASYRYPEYGQMQQRARENGTLDGTPVTPYSSFHEDQFHGDVLNRLNQRAAGRVMDEARMASPREFKALQRNESQMQDFLQQQTQQGRFFSGSEVNRMRAEGIENLYQEGQVGQGVGQANREYLELLDAWERTEANQHLKYGVGPQPGLPRRAYQESPFNPQRQSPPQPAPQARPDSKGSIPERSRLQTQHIPQHQVQARPQPSPSATPNQPNSRQGQDIRRLEPSGNSPNSNPSQARSDASKTPAPAAEPQARPYDPNKDSTALYKAMHGGITGWGTDEAALFKALEGKSPEQIEKIKANYKDHYGRDLDADLKKELSGKDLQRAQSLMEGNQASADATALRQSVGTLWNDNKQIQQTLEGKTAEERKAIADEYKKQTGKELRTELTRETSGANRDRTLALLDGDSAKADAARIQKAVKGMGTDEAAIMSTLQGKSAEERAAIEKAFQETYKVDLRTRLSQDLSGSELDQANALLEGNQAKADAASLKTAASGFFGADKKGINQALEGKTEEERKALAEAYQQTYGKELQSELQSKLSGNALEKSQALLERGQLSEAEQLKFAMEGWGTDEDAVKKALEGRSKEDVARIRQDYQSLTGRELDTDLSSEMSGRDHFDVTQSLKGRAETIDEAVARANEVHAYERQGGRNAISRGFVDLLSDKGKLLDTNVARVNESQQRFENLVAEGRMEEARAEKARLQELTGFATSDVETYREAKDSAADAAGTVAATAAGVAVVVATAGTATPLVTTALMAAGAGAGARVVTTGAIKGQGYGLEDGLMDAGIGAVDGGTSIIGMGAGSSARVAVRAGQEGAEAAARRALTAGGKVVAEAGEEGVEVGAKQLLLSSGKTAVNKAEERLVIQGAGDILESQSSQFVRQRMLEGARDGALGGAAGAGLSSAFYDETWDDGFASGLTRMATSTALGAGAGTLAGGGLSRIGAAKQWTGEVELYRNRANFNLLDDTQKLKYADLAQNYSRGQAFVDGGPSQNVDQRLIRMLRDGTVDRVDDAGATVVDNLSRLDNQNMASGLTNREIMNEVMETVNRPGVIHQDTKGSCTVTTIEYLHAKKDPSHFIKTVADLTGESGETTLKNGERVLRNPTGLKADGTTRSNIDRIYQSTMMDYGGGGHYDNLVDGHIRLDGSNGGSGLWSNGYNRVEEGVLGGTWRNRSFDLSDGPAAREAFERNLAEVTARGDQVPISMKFAADPKDMHSNHMLSVHKMDDEFVYLRNPWGKGDKGGSGGPPRQMLDNEGNFRMKKSDFYDRLNGYDVQSSTQGRPRVDLNEVKESMTQKFRRQAEEYSDDRWMKTTPEFIWEKWTPQERELHRTKLHERASNIVKEVEAGGDIHDIAAKHNLSEYYGLGDKHGRSEQFINRTEGTSNIHGRSKVAEPPPMPQQEAPPIPKPEPTPAPKPKPRLSEVRMPQTTADAYRILGLEQGASQQEVTQAYRRLAQANHPDKFPDQGDLATNNMKAINAARDLLR